MKRLLIALLILPCLLLAQPQVSKSNNTRTLLGSNATFNGTIEPVVADYNWLMVVVKANKNSATDGLVVRWSASNALPNTYTTIDKRTYVANDTLNGANVYRFPVAGAYFKVSYTNTSSAQTGTFSLTTYLVKAAWDINGKTTFSLSQATIDSLQASSTGNGSLEITQLLVLAELQNRINLGGLQTYSVRRGDFTATLKAGGKSIAITGASFTPSYLNFAYAYIINPTTGAKTVLPVCIDSVAGSSIRFPTATAFTATDVVGDVVFINAEKTLDKTNDASKVIDQTPPWSRFSPDQITNVAAGGDGASATTRTRTSMNGYKGISFHKQITTADAGDSVRVTIWASNLADPSTANDNDWVPIHTAFTQYVDGVATANIGLQGVLFSGASTTKRVMWTLTDAPYNWIMVKRVTTDAGTANVVITNDAYRRF